MRLCWGGDLLLSAGNKSLTVQNVLGSLSRLVAGYLMLFRLKYVSLFLPLPSLGNFPWDLNEL